jgi:predicted AAA+ superfamily ATPase
MNNTPKPRRSYDEQFKRDAVALLEGGRKAAQLARDLGVSPWNLRDWKKLYGTEAAAASHMQARSAALADPGPVFEQWVGLELWKRLQYQHDGQLSYLRSKHGAEIDFIIEKGGVVTPIEVKWTECPILSDARHLLRFLQEQGPKAPHGYIICRCAYPMQLHPQITALPWFCL